MSVRLYSSISTSRGANFHLKYFECLILFLTFNLSKIHIKEHLSKIMNIIINQVFFIRTKNNCKYK